MFVEGMEIEKEAGKEIALETGGGRVEEGG